MTTRITCSTLAALALLGTGCDATPAPVSPESTRAAPPEEAHVASADAGSLASPPTESTVSPKGACRVDTSANVTNGAFDRGAAAEALGCVKINDCGGASGPHGPGRVVVAFSPDGHVESAHLDAAPFLGTETGTCIEERFRSVRIPPYQGGKVKVGKSFMLPTK